MIASAAGQHRLITLPNSNSNIRSHRSLQ
jgi:hypothetical protein